MAGQKCVYEEMLNICFGFLDDKYNPIYQKMYKYNIYNIQKHFLQTILS